MQGLNLSVTETICLYKYSKYNNTAMNNNKRSLLMCEVLTRDIHMSKQVSQHMPAYGRFFGWKETLFVSLNIVLLLVEKKAN